MQKTKKIVGFIVEFYELDFYWIREDSHKCFGYNGEFKYINDQVYYLNHQCYKRTLKTKFNSVKKFHKFLALKKNKVYYFHQNLDEAINGCKGSKNYMVNNAPKDVLVVRQLHALGNNRYKY